MKIKLLALAIVWPFINSVFAQQENNIWYFGDSAGVDFNSGVPVALTNGAMDQFEGCSTISDTNGNLLFYTDGITVWDRNHIQMPNGYSLAGDFSSTQSALIVSFIGNNMMYYIFTVQDYMANNNNFSYSVVDMTLNGGNGDVTIKNSLLTSQVTEKLTAVKHSNNIDLWVMVRGINNNSFICYLISASGISLTPVISNIGPVITNGSLDMIGYMKFSPDGMKIAYAAHSANTYVDLFDFNSTTGVVSNEKFLNLPPGSLAGAYGLEFSRGGNYLYATICSPGFIFQWNISSNSAAVINSTLQQIVSAANGQAYGALQMSMDGKIYFSAYGKQYLGAINNPELPGVLCNFVDSMVYLNGSTCVYGLPNFITSYFLPTGIANFQSSLFNFQLYPNPGTDKIYISFPATTSENFTVKIYSTTGEVVFEEKNKSASPITKFQIPIFNISNGIYFLSVQTGREMVTRKIVVNH